MWSASIFHWEGISVALSCSLSVGWGGGGGELVHSMQALHKGGLEPEWLGTSFFLASTRKQSAFITYLKFVLANRPIDNTI